MKDIFKFILIGVSVFIVIFAIFAIAGKNATKKKNVTIADSSLSSILSIKPVDNIRGNKEALLTIVDYSDYQCPYCIRYDNTLNQIMTAYPTQVKWVYRHFPLPFHQAAKAAALAAEAAGAQGKYWEYHDKLVANSQPDGKGLQETDLLKYATDLGLNFDQFNRDRTDSKYIDKVENDIKDGTALKVQGTPSSYLVDKNGNIEQLQGALTFQQLRSKIDDTLKK